MVNNKKVVLVSDRALPNKTQVYVEHPPILASKVKRYLNAFREIRKNISGTYPGAKFFFVEVDAFDKPLIQEN